VKVRLDDGLSHGLERENHVTGGDRRDVIEPLDVEEAVFDLLLAYFHRDLRTGTVPRPDVRQLLGVSTFMRRRKNVLLASCAATLPQAISISLARASSPSLSEATARYISAMCTEVHQLAEVALESAWRSPGDIAARMSPAFFSPAKFFKYSAALDSTYPRI
jgi:hypothetical protein